MVVTDRQQQIRLLNADFVGEHEAIVHYLTHAWTVAFRFGPAIEAIARDEMRHMKWLGHAIVALGGAPDLTPPHALPVMSGQDAMRYDIGAEEEAIRQYLEHQETIANDRVRTLIGRILTDERDHLRRFTQMHDQISGDEWGDRETDGEVGEVAYQLQRLVGEEYQAILAHLLHSFVAEHTHQVGLSSEDRAQEEMRHLAFMAETLSDLGVQPEMGREAISHQRMDETHRARLYHEVGQWLETREPDLVPELQRIMAHEGFHRVWQRVQPGFTVGRVGQEGLR